MIKQAMDTGSLSIHLKNGARRGAAVGSWRRAAPLAFGLMAACAPALDSTPPRFPFATGWQSPMPGAPRLMDNALWWSGFGDPVLDALVARGLRANPDLTAARARSTAAVSAARSVPGAIILSGGTAAALTGGSAPASDRTASADLGLEILFDPGRGRESTRRAVRAEAGIGQAQAAGARLFMIGEIVESYLRLRHSQQRLNLAQSDFRSQRQTLELARTLEKAGQATRLETLRSEARMASLEAQMPALEAAVAKEKIQLSILVGDAPGGLPPNLSSALSKHVGQPRARLAPNPGVPADLLRNRPDIQVAEASYDAARAGLGRARAALYPSLSLSGTIEAERRLGGGTSGSTLSVGPSFRLPVLPQDSTRTGIDAAAARVEAAHADWTSRVLKALAEVESALLDYRAASRSENAADRAVSLYAKSRSLTRDLAADGDATLSDLITIEEALALAQSAQADQRLTRALAFARLNLRLGAGSAPSAVPDAQVPKAP